MPSRERNQFSHGVTDLSFLKLVHACILGPDTGGERSEDILNLDIGGVIRNAAETAGYLRE